MGKVSDLTEMTTLAQSDDLYVVDDVLSRRITALNLGNTLPVKSTGSTTARTLAARFADVINVKDFGAVGDGVTDDTSAVQAAVDLAESGGGGVIFFPAGTYLVSTQLTIVDAAVRFLGAGAEVSILRFSGVNGISISQPTLTLRQPVHLDALSFLTDGNGLYDAITLDGQSTTSLATQFIAENCVFRGVSNSTAWRRGIDLTSGSYFSRVAGCYFRGNTADRTKMAIAIRVDGSTDVKIRDNFIYWADTGIQVSGASEGIIIQGHHMVPVNRGVRFMPDANSNYGDISHNHIDAHINGIVMGQSGVNGANHSQINHNLIFKNSSSTDNFVGIQVESDRVSVVGNEVMKTGTSGTKNGIVLGTGADRCRVVANHVNDMDTGILVQSGGNNNVVQHNTFNNNSTNISDSGTGTVVQKAEYAKTLTATLTGGAATETLDVSIPSGLFAAKPSAAFLLARPTEQIVGFYDYDSASSTATNARFTLARNDSTNIGAGVERFSFVAFE